MKHRAYVLINGPSMLDDIVQDMRGALYRVNHLSWWKEGLFQAGALTDFFEEITERLDFQYWLFGHYHGSWTISSAVAFMLFRAAKRMSFLRIKTLP